MAAVDAAAATTGDPSDSTALAAASDVGTATLVVSALDVVAMIVVVSIIGPAPGGNETTVSSGRETPRRAFTSGELSGQQSSRPPSVSPVPVQKLLTHNCVNSNTAMTSCPCGQASL